MELPLHTGYPGRGAQSNGYLPIWTKAFITLTTEMTMQVYASYRSPLRMSAEINSFLNYMQETMVHEWFPTLLLQVLSVYQQHQPASFAAG